jgi:hypothetical protein
MIDVMAELKPIGALFAAADYQAGLKLLAELWDRIPAPKESVNNSYLIVSYGVALARKVGDLDLAWEWALKGLAYSGGFNLGGESEFLVAEVAFARGDQKAAGDYFRVARKISGGRLFRDKTPKYWELAG